jgi:hypothetical protein
MATKKPTPPSATPHCRNGSVPAELAAGQVPPTDVKLSFLAPTEE